MSEGSRPAGRSEGTPIGGGGSGDGNRAVGSPPASAQHALRAFSQNHAELARRARMVQRETLSPAVQHEYGLGA